MLFVLPESQGSGLGRELLDRVAADRSARWSARPRRTAPSRSRTRCTPATGIVPRMPLFNLTGLPQRPEAFGALPSGRRPARLRRDRRPARPDGQGHRLLAEAVDALDRELLGVAHPADHRFLRTESRHGWLYRGPDGDAGRLRLRGRGRPRRADRRPGRGAARPGPRPPDRRSSCRAARSRCGSAARRTGRSSRRSGPASGSTRSRSCCAGTGRSPTSRRYLPISPGLL